MVYGWSHAFAIWDLLRGQSMGWQPTGGTGRKNRTGRLWWGMAVWTAGSGVLWTGLAAHRMIDDDLWTFAPAFLGGAFYLAVVVAGAAGRPSQAARGTSVKPRRSR